jgi:hypothetical protein
VENASVGKLLPNYSVYILDKMTAKPILLSYPGVIGVRGRGVALGYISFQGLSATKLYYRLSGEET